MIINEKKVKENKDGEDGCYIIASVLIVLGAYWCLFSSKTWGLIASLVGLFVIFCGRNNKRLRESLFKYIEIMGDKEVISISELASRAGETEKLVINNLEHLIINNYFENMQIDSGNKFLRARDYFEKYSVQEEKDEIGEVQQITNKKENYYSAICDCCGGTTKIKVGGGGVCEYCRAPIGIYKELDE